MTFIHDEAGNTRCVHKVCEQPSPCQRCERTTHNTATATDCASSYSRRDVTAYTYLRHADAVNLGRHVHAVHDLSSRIRPKTQQARLSSGRRVYGRDLLTFGYVSQRDSKYYARCLVRQTYSLVGESRGVTSGEVVLTESVTSVACATLALYWAMRFASMAKLLLWPPPAPPRNDVCSDRSLAAL